MKPDEIIKIIEYIKEQTDFKGDIFININSNAIPIEWIEKWFSQFYGEQGLEWNRCKRFMLEDWEKENKD